MLNDELVQDAQARLLARIDATGSDPPAGFPHAADGATRRWEAKPGGAWTDGFWVGLTPVEPGGRRPPGMLLHGCYNLYTGAAPDHELVWGDYFLLEALARWQGRA